MKTVFTLINLIVLQISLAAPANTSVGDEPKKNAENAGALYSPQLDQLITEALDTPMAPLSLEFTWADRAAEDAAITNSTLPPVAPLEVNPIVKPSRQKAHWRTATARLQL